MFIKVRVNFLRLSGRKCAPRGRNKLKKKKIRELGVTADLQEIYNYQPITLYFAQFAKISTNFALFIGVTKIR